MNDAPKTSGLAIAALVCGVAFCVPLAPLVGIVLGIVALSKIKNSNGRLTGQGLAIAGICVGAFGIIANVGVLAAIAIPNFIKFQQRAKQSESRAKLSSIAAGANAYYAENKKFPESSGEWVPASCAAGAKCAADPEAFTKSPWSELGFAPDGPGYYQVRFVNAGSSFVAEAQGDLDADGNVSLFRITGAANASGEVNVEPVVDTTPGEF